MNTQSNPASRVTVPYLLESKEYGESKEHGESKERGQTIAAVTAYDYTSACLIEQAGDAIDLVLVGDSLGSVIQGHENTLPVTLDDVLYHTKCVRRGLYRALLVADLPFLSYQASVEQAITSSGRLLKEAGAEAVKLEGGESMRETIAALSRCDIPVVGHVGLTPQSYHRMGGHRIQGKRNPSASQSSAQQILEDAKAVEEAGAFAVVLEGVPGEVAAEITESLHIPTIGIGAGPQCDGQILVLHDLLGLTPGKKPRFVKTFAELGEASVQALQRYSDEVRSGVFPSEQHTFSDPLPVRMIKS